MIVFCHATLYSTIRTPWEDKLVSLIQVENQKNGRNYERCEQRHAPQSRGHEHCQDRNESDERCNVKQVGVVQVSQSGTWVMQLAGGGTIPVRVEGGRMVVDIGSGLEGLAIDLADEEVSLRAVGAI